MTAKENITKWILRTEQIYLDTDSKRRTFFEGRLAGLRIALKEIEKEENGRK